MRPSRAPKSNLCARLRESECETRNVRKINSELTPVIPVPRSMLIHSGLISFKSGNILILS